MNNRSDRLESILSENVPVHRELIQTSMVSFIEGHLETSMRREIKNVKSRLDLVLFRKLFKRVRNGENFNLFLVPIWLRLKTGHQQL